MLSEAELMEGLFDELEGPSPSLSEFNNELSESVLEAHKLTLECQGLEAELKINNKRKNYLLDKVIPDLMEQIGLAELTIPIDNDDEQTCDDYSVKVTEKLYGSIPKNPDKRSKAIEYLREHGGSEIVKAEIVIPLLPSTQDDTNLINFVMGGLLALGLAANITGDVNHMTLKKWIRDKMKSGEIPNMKTLGVFEKKTSKVVKK